MTRPMLTRCVRCDKAVEWKGTPPFAVDAVVFMTPGNFGSRVFDEIHGDRLVGIICDACVGEADLRVQKKLTPRVTWEDRGTYAEWDADQRARMAAVKDGP